MRLAAKVTGMSGRFGGRARALVHAPFVLVLLVVLSGFVFVAMQHWRRGSLLIGGALLLAAALRAVLSSEQLGLVAIRSRAVDLLLYSGLGLLLVTVAATIKP